MPNVPFIDLRPDFGNDFARIFMERERLKLQQDAQKFTEKQTKYENEQKEAEIARAKQAMEGSTAGIMQGLLGSPQGQALLGGMAQPYADAFNTFFGGGGAQATPEQLGLTPQGMASGIMQGPEPYAAAGFASALKDTEQQQYTRQFAKTEADRVEGRFDRSYELNERQFEHTKWADQQKLDLERAQQALMKNTSDRQAHMQALGIVTGMQDRVREAFAADLNLRINLGEEPRAAYQRASLAAYGQPIPPDPYSMNQRAGRAVGALEKGLPVEMVGRMALGDGSDPLLQLANLGLDERVVTAISRGYTNGEDPYNMYKDVHEVIAMRRNKVTSDEAKNIKTRTGLSKDDYFASQLNTYTTWFVENYPNDDPKRLIGIYKNSLIDPDAFDPDEKFEFKGHDSLAKFAWHAVTAWSQDSSPEERERSTKAILGSFEFDRDTSSPPVVGTSRPTKAPAVPGAGPLGLSSTNQLLPQSFPSGIGMGGGATPGSPVQQGDRVRQPGIDPITTITDSIDRWTTNAEMESDTTSQEFGEFLWEVKDLWSAITGQTTQGDTGQGQGDSGALRGLGTNPQFLRDSVDRATQGVPSAGPPRNILQTMIGGGAPASDSFRVPTDPRQTTPRILHGQPEPVPGWVSPDQEAAYQDTAQMLRAGGVEEDTVRMILELNFKPKSTMQGGSALTYRQVY